MMPTGRNGVTVRRPRARARTHRIARARGRRTTRDARAATLGARHVDARVDVASPRVGVSARRARARSRVSNARRIGIGIGIGPTRASRRRRARASSDAASETEEYCALVNERNEVIGSATRRADGVSRALGRGAFGVVLKRAPVDARADDGSASTSASDAFTALVTRRSARKDVWPTRSTR